MHQEASNAPHSRGDEINPFNGQPHSNRYFELKENRDKLPIKSYRDNIINFVKENQITYIVSEPGTGKTTQIPEYLLESSICPMDKKILCVNSNKDVILTASRRVSSELDTSIGVVVGFATPFESVYSEKCRLIYMTDNLLLRELAKDPKLQKYGIIILDDISNRSLETDILLGFLGTMLKENADLKIVLTSLLDSSKKITNFIKEIGKTQVINVIRENNIPVFYSDSQPSFYVLGCVEKAVEILNSNEFANVLVFLTEKDEVTLACEMLQEKIKIKLAKTATILPFYSGIERFVIEKLYKPDNRKVIFATDIAEQSLPICGITHVIDCGFSYEKRYSPQNNKSINIKRIISKRSAECRRECASQGCYRMYPQIIYEKKMESYIPEVQRADLSSIILTMLTLGITDIVHFPYIDPPHFKLLVGALECLYHLQAIDAEGQINSIGRDIARLPIDARTARTIITAIQSDVKDEVITIVSMMSQPNLFVRPKTPKERSRMKEALQNMIAPTSDHISLLSIFNEAETALNDGQPFCEEHFIDQAAFDKALAMKEKLMLFADNLEVKTDQMTKGSSSERILRSFLSGGFMRIGHYDINLNAYVFFDGNAPAKPDEFSVLGPILGEQTPSWVCYEEHKMLPGGNLISVVSEIELEWAVNAAPEYFNPDNFKGSQLAGELIKLYESTQFDR